MFKRFICSVLVVMLVLQMCASCFAADWTEKEKSAAKFGKVMVSGTSDKAQWAYKGKHGKKINLSSYGVDGSLSYFHGMFYEAKVLKTVKAKKVGSSKKVEVKKGTSVIIINYRGEKKAVCKVKKSKKAVWISSNNLKIRKFIYNSSKPYADAQVEDWVNSMKFKSSSKYLIVASKFNQRAWIMEKSNKNKNKWFCRYILKVTTSSITSVNDRYRPADYLSFNDGTVGVHYIDRNMNPMGISISKLGNYQIHLKSKFLYPSTSGSLGVGKKEYNFIVNYIPRGTKVVVF